MEEFDIVTKEYLEALIRKVAVDLVQIYPRENQPATKGLIFPKKRDGSLRVSEQEAKHLFTRHLTMDSGLCFSVETPTNQTYRQTGAGEISARIDLSLYGREGHPAVNIELKAHKCGVESMRKDWEKLLREQTIGVWFHTVEWADSGTLQVLMERFREAFELLSDHIRNSNKSYLIGICGLGDGSLHWTWLQFTGEPEGNLSAVEMAFGGSNSSLWSREDIKPEQPRDNHSPPPIRTKLITTSRGKGAKEGLFVFMPSVERNTFMHLSVRGGSYKLRNYQQSGPSQAPRAFTVPGYVTFEDLQESGLLVQWWEVTTEDSRHNLIKEPGYWYQRICAVNSKHLPQ